MDFYGFELVNDEAVLTEERAKKRHTDELKAYIIHDNVLYLPTDSRLYRVLSAYTAKRSISIDEYIKSLGFERTKDRPLSVSEEEADMQVHPCTGTFLERLFSEYPLIGSYVLKPETLEKLNANAGKYIDAVLRNPQKKLSAQAEMELTVALINYAKGWKTEENGNFWGYITLQFGYRDNNGRVLRILQNSLENAMKRNGRLFVEDIRGRAFKTTAVIHALTTRKSWMALFDFLFDFYKDNLNWRAVPGDPLLGVMVQLLKTKLTGDGEDMELTISSHVYSFQEGIRKLILLRPLFAQTLFEKLIGRIDALIRSEAATAKSYEEQLCDDWFREKLSSIAGARKTDRQGQSAAREIAIDYSKIRARYVLKNENCIQLSLPDIRIKGETLEKAEVTLLLGDNPVLRQRLKWYGNELGKTLIGTAVTVPSIPEGSESIALRMKISCDDQVIYDSGDDLYRRILVFFGENEVTAESVKSGNYSFVVPIGTEIKAQNAEITEMEAFLVPGLKAFFLELSDGFVITAGERLLSYDSENGSEMRVIAPEESASLPQVTLGNHEYFFARQNSACTFLFNDREYTRHFVLLKNGERIDFLSLPSSEHGKAFLFPFSGEKGQCRLQVINLVDERLLFDRCFFIIDRAECSFDREFYYSASDYKNAQYHICIDDYQETASFDASDDEIRIPYGEGILHALIPKVILEESSGSWHTGSGVAVYVGDVPQNSLLKITSPPSIKVQLYLGGGSLQYDGKGLAAVGNAIHAVTPGHDPCAALEMRLEGRRYSQTYSLGTIYFKERFLKQPVFWTEESTLYWDRGGGFVGKTDRQFRLELIDKSGDKTDFTLEEDTQSIQFHQNMPAGNYRYAVSIETRSLFSVTREVIAEGDCVIGDKNVLRFLDRRIVLEAVTDEDREDSGHISIRPCYIDQISFLGIEDTSEGLCPVYQGVMYSVGQGDRRYEFSYDAHTNSRGIKKMPVNPVRIVYVGDAALCITDPDGDGLYYYRFYDKANARNVYALTDYEYTKETKQRYSTADLYSYRTERI